MDRNILFPILDLNKMLKKDFFNVDLVNLER